MPKYFFHVQDGLDITDDEGFECADLEAALSAAIRYAGSLLKESGTRLHLGDVWSLEVFEEATCLSFSIDLQIRPRLAPAAPQPSQSAA